MSGTESKRPAVCISLNDRATFKLSPEGRTVWRAHVEQQTAMMRNFYGQDWKPTESGDETEVTLQIWKFISIFGASKNWYQGGPYVLADMNIEVQP